MKDLETSIMSNALKRNSTRASPLKTVRVRVRVRIRVRVKSFTSQNDPRCPSTRNPFAEFLPYRTMNKKQV